MTSFLHPMAFDRNDVMILRNEETLEPQAANAQLQTKFLKHLGERTYYMSYYHMSLYVTSTIFSEMLIRDAVAY